MRVKIGFLPLSALKGMTGYLGFPAASCGGPLKWTYNFVVLAFSRGKPRGMGLLADS